MDPTKVLHYLVARDAPAPTGTTPAQQFLNLVSDPFRSQLQGQAFITSLITAFGATAIIALAFCFVRPYNQVVYAPRLKHADEKHAPPALGRSPWAWLSPVVKTKEQLLVEKVGMDATIFMRFTNMCRNMFLVLSIAGCAILLPVYLGQSSKLTGLSTFTKLTPQKLDGNKFWAPIAVAWLFNLIVLGFLWWNYRGVAKLRRHYFESYEYQSSLHSRTVMVTDIPKDMTTDEGVIRLVDHVKNSTVIPRASIGRNVKELPDLIEEHEELVRKLEEVLAKYLKNPDKLPPNRPMCKPSKKDPEYNNGEKVDAINYLTARIQRLEKQIQQVRATLDQRNAMSYGFASYETLDDAHSTAYLARKKHPCGTTIKLAPRPSDIIWKNVALSLKARKARTFINNLWIILLTLVWIAPNALIAVFLANLGNLGLIWPSFDTELHNHSKSWALVQGVLAPAITSLFYWLLPAIFRKLAMNAGDQTKTSRDRHVMSKLYAFFVFNNLIIFSLFGAVWQFIAAVIKAKNQNEDVLEAIKRGNIPNKIFITLCNVSPFWASWLLQRNLGAAIDLAQIANLAWGSFRRRFMSPTPRQVIELSAPPPFDYASYYNYFLFYTTVALCFATISPIVLPITAVYFCLDAWLKKYLLMYVFTTKTESGGKFWKPLFNRMLFAVFLSDIIVALVVYANTWQLPLQTWVTMLGALVPLPIILILFKMYCHRAFQNQCEYYTKGNFKGEEANLADDKSTRSDRIAIRFGHPALYKPLLTPMVHAKAQHMLSKVYNGRLDEDDDDMSDMASIAGYSDTYSMHNIARNHRRKASRQQLKSSPFEFVSESDMDFENFKNRDDFRSEFGGEGEMYGRPEDASSRNGTPTGIKPFEITAHRTATQRPSNLRSISQDSDLTDHTYPHGYSQTFNPSNARAYSPDRFTTRSAGGQETTLLHSAAPMGNGYGDSISRTTTPGSESYRGRTPGGDPYRGRQF